MFHTRAISIGQGWETVELKVLLISGRQPALSMSGAGKHTASVLKPEDGQPRMSGPSIPSHLVIQASEEFYNFLAKGKLASQSER